jgi:hypothetical protein
MVGSAIAGSLVHEVGHQGAALLDLVKSLRPVLQARRKEPGGRGLAWGYWDRWISEIVADFWSVARVGVAATVGLIGVVSLPRAFVFRIVPDDPHPFPWIRVQFCCATGQALYPDPQWARLAAVWSAMYPKEGLSQEQALLLAHLDASIPEFVDLLLNHRPAALGGRAMRQALDCAGREPARLRDLWREWRSSPSRARRARPTIAFAVIGQARADGLMTAREESEWLGRLLTFWALRGTLDMSELCASQARHRITHPQI